MLRSYHHWNSSALGRKMELLVFGQGGARVFAFPTCEGRFFDWEDHGMVEAVKEYVDIGLLQLFCLDSIDGEAWFAENLHPAVRARRQVQYDSYLRHEVEPFSRRLNANPVLMTAGTSFGAYHALNFAFRYPQLVGRALSLSGFWDLKWLTGGYYDETIYFHNPIDFVLNEHDPERLAALRRMDIIFAVGAEEYVRPNAEFLSGELWRKGIGNALRVWEGIGHDWYWWGQMIQKYIGGYD
jgi:esterase/lipase superfamily enzyme